ncbi:MAG: RagB/SusD family nutrient uptake outer membrane protein [Dysgonamonadaceae bacterium]|jgi:tetratricopeptide (TPR) repeat protein|nr:RagB/SusD family nutrient uptake outer membrane protein [Dysgonamonadaceae bacterium]
MKLYQIKLVTLVLLIGILSSCTDVLEPADSRYVTADELPNILDRNSDALIQGVYARSIQYAFYASRHDDFGQKSIDLAVDLSSEDVVHMSSSWFLSFYQFNDRVASNAYSPSRQWKYAYAQIRDLNSIIEVLEDESELSDAQKNLKGEALALRAFHYFFLVNFYQTGGSWDNIQSLPGVPVYTDNVLEGKPRNTVEEVYNQILSDYEAAIPLLAGFESSPPTRITQTAAKLLAARAYLYAGKYDKALEYATQVVDTTQLTSTANYTKGFADIGDVEWLWGVDINSENSTIYPSFFSIIDPFSAGYAGMLGQYKSIDRRLYDQIDANDVRKTLFEGADGGELEVPYVQKKFVDHSGSFLGDYVYLRSAEAWYIKAEAEARIKTVAEAHATLDVVTNARTIDGNHAYQWSTDKNTLLDQIFVQKRIELWGEGHGLFEFNRLEKTIDRTYDGTNHPPGNINSGDRPLPWHDPLRTFQIPIKELEGNPYITQDDQNP